MIGIYAALAGVVPTLHSSFKNQIVCTNPKYEKGFEILVEEMKLKGEEDSQALEKLFQATKGG